MPRTFHDNNNEISDPYTIAEKFNEYFTNVGPNLAKKIPNTTTSFKTYLNKINENIFFISPVTEEEVERELSKLNPNKSAGFEDLSIKIMRQLASHIKHPLTLIFNKSFTTGIITENLKISVITPVYKNEENNIFSNYRPVAVLPCFSKILEKIMYQRLISFIEKHDILYKQQYGFRKNHSTEMAIIDLTTKISESIDKNEYTAGIFIDLSKAFDTVNHLIVIKKLKHYGVRGIPLEWFKNYLTERN